LCKLGLHYKCGTDNHYGAFIAMLDKELAQATKMAETANNKVEQLRKKLVSESEKSHARLKRELGAARKRHSVASARLKRAKAALRKMTTPDNQKKVDALVKQVQDLGDSVGKVAKAAYAAAEKLVTVKTDAILEARKAKAANQAAAMVERAASRSKKKPAKKKKAAAKKKPTAKKKAAAKKKPTARKKVAAKKKAAAKRKAAPKRKAAVKKKAAAKR
jgi:colicin import membrane protein